MTKINKVIFNGLPFLVSFATLSGQLNVNHYIKLFVFALAFVLLCIVSFSSKYQKNLIFNLGDLCVSCLFLMYIYSFACGNNLLDHSLSLMYFIFYYFLRLYNHLFSLKIISYFAVYTIIVHIIICILQYFNLFENNNSYFQIGSTFGNPDMLAAYISILLPFCYTANIKYKRYVYIIFATSLVLFLLLQARTALIASVISFIVYYFQKNNVSIKYKVLFIAFVIILIIALASWHFTSVSGRVAIWIMSFAMILQKPFGWGLYAFEKHYLEFQSNFLINNPHITEFLNVDIVHSPYNEFLNIAVALGVIGALFYLIFIVYTLKLTYKSNQILFYPLLSFQIVSLSYFPFRVIPLAVIYIILCILALSHSKAGKFTIPNKFNKIYSLALLLIVLSLMLPCSYAYNQWNKAVIFSQNEETYTNAEKYFSNCYPLLKGNGRYLASFAELHHKMNNKDTALFYMQKATQCFSDIGTYNNLAILYEETGDISKAKTTFVTAVNMAPNNYQIALSHIYFLKRIGCKEQAYKLAVDLNRKLESDVKSAQCESIKQAVNLVVHGAEPEF